MIKHKSCSESYIELCFHVDGGKNLFLRVPTVWDDIQKIWRGFIKTPKTQKLIHVEGKNSCDLQNAFTKKISEILNKEDYLADEVFNMFQPLSYWDEME